MLFEFFRWWYGTGWREAWKNIGTSAGRVQKNFSIGILLQTLFSPWKQIVSSPRGSLDDKARASIDNLISRTVGFFMRLLSIVSALVLMLLTAAAGLLVALAWPLLPLAIIYCLFRSITG